jgi:hypothetical protein
MSLQNPLQDKFGVLYVLENNEPSSKALQMAQALPEIYVQYVSLLSVDQVPKWLKEVPTCVVLSNRKVLPGSEALKLLADLYTTKQQQLMQYKQMAPPPQSGPYPSYPPPQSGPYPSYPPPQSGPYQAVQPMPYPTQLQSTRMPQMPEQSRMQVQQAMPRQMNPQQLMPQQMNPQQQMQQRMMAQGNGMPQQGMSQPMYDPESEPIKGSIQPASGTGQYGCSLASAFSSDEESTPPQEDSRFGQGGKVEQRDIESYLRVREQSGKIKPQGGMVGGGL